MKKFEEAVRLITEAVILPETVEPQTADTLQSGMDTDSGEQGE